MPQLRMPAILQSAYRAQTEQDMLRLVKPATHAHSEYRSARQKPAHRHGPGRHPWTGEHHQPKITRLVAVEKATAQDTNPVHMGVPTTLREVPALLVVLLAVLLAVWMAYLLLLAPCILQAP